MPLASAQNPFSQLFNPYINLGGVTIPCYKWEIDVNAYGQLSHATVHTTVSMLRAAGINVPQLTSATSRVPASISLNNQRMFSGTYRHGFYEFHTDEIELFLRDSAAILFDTKRSLADVDYEGLTVSQFVKNIVNKYGEIGKEGGLAGQPIINITNDPAVGTIFQQTGIVTGPTGSSMATYPRPIWDMLVVLAKWVAANIYTDTQGFLHFEQVTNPFLLNYSWKPPAQNPNIGILDKPIKELTVLHQPENNKNFNVIVISHNQQSAQFVSATSTMIGEDISAGGTDTIKPKLYSGADGSAIRSTLSSRGLGIPTYYFPVDGLTAVQAQSRADSIASEYAKRLYVVTAQVDGAPGIQPLNQLNIDDSSDPGSLLGFANEPLFVNNVRHSFEVPQTDGISRSGFLTTMKCLTLPPTAEGE